MTDMPGLGPAQLSPDGRWRWDGTRWVPVTHAYATVTPRTNPLSLASFVLSVIVPLVPLTSIAAIVCGVIALRQNARSAELKGNGLAIAGIVISAICISLLGLLLFLFLAFAIGCSNSCFTF